MPEQRKKGKVQFNAWLDADAAKAVRRVMREKQYNKSDAVRFLIREALGNYETGTGKSADGPGDEGGDSGESKS